MMKSLRSLKVYVRLVTLITFIIIIWGCTPIIKQPPPLTALPDVKFNKVDPYSFDHSKISKPKEPPQVDFVTKVNANSYKVVPKDQATEVVLTQSEYAKIWGLVRALRIYQEVVDEQVILINSYGNRINFLQEAITLERQRVEEYQNRDKYQKDS